MRIFATAIISTIAFICAAGCASADPDGGFQDPVATGDPATSDDVNAADDGDGQLGESAEELSSCQTLQTIKCNGGQPGSLTAFKKVCNDYCWYRGWPSCSHTWTKCPAVADGIIPIVKQYGYGGQCRCRVSWSGVQ
ncbi:MAG: hypothetical protein KC776_04375 [Myxococcales bacterium]|nr:hypothetical protein [Myxococcales bacterium]MCB9580067.1 hypothetical protein [Polyangiaceae bacterium]